MNELTKNWKDAKGAIAIFPLTTEQLIATAQEKKKGILHFHYGNVLVLGIALIAVALFFYFTPFYKSTSKTGIGLMLSGLSVRIFIEIWSIFKYKAIRFVNDASKTADAALAFYHYRQKIHGPATISTVAMYIIGFYLLSPEFAEYMPLKWMVLMNVFFLAGGAILILQTRKGIQKEAENLSYLIRLKNEMIKTD